MKIIVSWLDKNYELEYQEDVAKKSCRFTDPVYAAAYIERNVGAQSTNYSLEDPSVHAAFYMGGVLGTKNTNSSEEEASWEHRSVQLFLDECRRHKKDLRNPKIRRRNIFLKIKEVMESKGYKLKEGTLEKKLSNMKISYNRILDNKKKPPQVVGAFPGLSLTKCA
ncbi:uncharacterized protein LOC129920862 [Episyrphus balteatus]|uniref:uncharacterized protein LOC129920862 n=1 Tax=Episyrphus balteatus TaxID=286459 RepID=UPI0024863FFA|nr:uncharacterized protein LOC129920862 [Episyrphus balteatus]